MLGANFYSPIDQADHTMEDFIDQDELQISIEEDILGGASERVRSRPAWKFGRITKPNVLQARSTTPSLSQDSGIISTQPSQVSQENEFVLNKQARNRKIRQELSYSTAICLDETDSDDLYVLDEKPPNFSQRPAKKVRYSYSTMPSALSNIQSSSRIPRPSPATPRNNRIEIQQDDYLEDEDLNALLRSMVLPEEDIESDMNLLPDTDQEINDLEREEAAEAVEEEEEDETANEFMTAVAVAVVERSQTPLDIIEISSDGEIVKERPRPRRERTTLPNITLGPNNLPMTEVQQGSYTYKIGQGVEFFDGTFMRIKSIFRSHQGTIKLFGSLLIRHSQVFLDPKQPQSTRLFPSSGWQNEVIWTVTIDEKPRSDFVQRELSEAVRSREIVFTNQLWPCISSQVYHGGRPRGSSLLLNEGILFCRLKHVRQAEIKKANQDYEQSIERLTEEEADAKDSIRVSKLSRAWHHHHVTSKGGSVTTTQEILAIDGSIKSEKVIQYTFADCFCGCGGASRGAQLAGLAVQWAIDADPKAARSYRANFKSTTFYEEDVSDYLFRLGKPGEAAAFKVDVLHMSPPCQAFSPARTSGCPIAKEHLEALILSVPDLLQRLRPRIATLEETAGLIRRHKDWTARIIRSIIDLGYSVKWKIIKGQTLGAPQLRERLIIIAAAPGEVLPPWPKATHGPTSVTKRALATIHDAISNIPPCATHNKVNRWFPQRKESYSPQTQAKTVTCGGANKCHPSGLRHFTAREAACLQTFPFLHSFADNNLTAARKQIGNAWSPVTARAVYKEIIKSLNETDGVK